MFLYGIQGSNMEEFALELYKCPNNVLSQLNFRFNYKGKKEWISNCEDIFRTYVFNQKFTLFSKPVELIHGGDFKKCFDKFIIGDEKYHKQRKVDRSRMERLKWIYDILTNFSKCYYDNCDKYIFSRYKHEKKDRVVIYCKNHSYALFLHEYVDKYVLVSAYIVEYKKSIEKIANNKCEY